MQPRSGRACPETALGSATAKTGQEARDLQAQGSLWAAHRQQGLGSAAEDWSPADCLAEL